MVGPPAWDGDGSHMHIFCWVREGGTGSLYIPEMLVSEVKWPFLMVDRLNPFRLVFDRESSTR